MNKKNLRVNFLPREMRPSPLNHRNFFYLILFCGIAVPALSGALGAYRWKVSQEYLEASAARDEANRELNSRLTLRAESADQRSLASVQEAVAQKIYWAVVFKELSNVAPKSLWLTDFETKASAEGRSVLITGSSASQKHVAEFLGNLESSYFFRNVQMKFAEAREDSTPRTFRFQFEGLIFDPPGGAPDGKN